MSDRESLIAYFTRRRDDAKAKLVDGQYACIWRDAMNTVAHYDNLIGKLSR